MSDVVHPYRIGIPQSELDDLRARLRATRWPDELPGVGWDLGIPLDVLRELAGYWERDYDWRRAEARLNEWPQFVTEIDGTRIHFAHLRSPEPDALPLIMTHGWPGSIVEFQDVVGPLTDPRAHGGDPGDAFDLVLPSIPGFGLSGPTREKGWEFQRVARAFAVLMDRLGYDRYGTQGGDWGYVISRELGRLAPGAVVGVHLNLIGNYVTAEPTADDLAGLTASQQDDLHRSWQRTAAWQAVHEGYAALQSTRPQTLAYALTDSPVGQLAWIVEKFYAWSGSTSQPGDAIDRDQLLTNVMLYWLTGTAGSSARIYYERAHGFYPDGEADAPSRTPTAVALFPDENFLPVRHLAERTNNIVRWTVMDRGGHFAAMEQPQLLVEDVRSFFRGLRDSERG